MKFLRQLGVLLCVAVAFYVLWKLIGTNTNEQSHDQDAANLSSSDVVRIGVYYESLCSDSIKFIINQLWPTYRKVESLVQIDLVPYGKASYQRSGDHWVFRCQHGPAECTGNMVQACALKHYPDTKKNLPFVHCVMSANNPPDAGRTCAASTGLNWDVINQCAKSTEGEDILHQMGVATDSLNPRLHFVPWITINGKSSDAILDEALSDLLGLVCKSFSGPTTPPACA